MKTEFIAEFGQKKSLSLTSDKDISCTVYWAHKLNAKGTKYDQVAREVDIMEDSSIAMKGGQKKDLKQCLVAEQILLRTIRSWLLI